MRTLRLATTRRPGFTMLELVLVLSMMAVVAMISAGRISSMITGWRVTRASQAFAEELQSAFAIVGRNRKPVTIVFDTARMELRLVDRAAVRYRLRSFGPTSEYRLQARDVVASRLTVEVYPPGLAADSLSLSIDRPGASRRVRMLRGGLVQICGSGATNRCD